MKKDTEITDDWGVPIQTLQKWKKTENTNWRSKIYNLLCCVSQQEQEQQEEERHILISKIAKDNNIAQYISFRIYAIKTVLKWQNWEVQYQIIDIIAKNDKFIKDDYIDFLSGQRCKISEAILSEISNLEMIQKREGTV